MAGMHRKRGRTDPENDGDYPVGGVADEYTPSTGPGGGSSGRAISLSGERVE